MRSNDSAYELTRETAVLEFVPGEAAQVYFGKGPEIVDVAGSKYSCGFPMVIFQQPTQAFFTAD